MNTVLRGIIIFYLVYLQIGIIAVQLIFAVDAINGIDTGLSIFALLIFQPIIWLLQKGLNKIKHKQGKYSLILAIIIFSVFLQLIDTTNVFSLTIGFILIASLNYYMYKRTTKDIDYNIQKYDFRSLATLKFNNVDKEEQIFIEKKFFNYHGLKENKYVILKFDINPKNPEEDIFVSIKDINFDSIKEVFPDSFRKSTYFHVYLGSNVANTVYSNYIINFKKNSRMIIPYESLSDLGIITNQKEITINVMEVDENFYVECNIKLIILSQDNSSHENLVVPFYSTLSELQNNDNISKELTKDNYENYYYFNEYGEIISKNYQFIKESEFIYILDMENIPNYIDLFSNYTNINYVYNAIILQFSQLYLQINKFLPIAEHYISSIRYKVNLVDFDDFRELNDYLLENVEDYTEIIEYISKININEITLLDFTKLLAKINDNNKEFTLFLQKLFKQARYKFTIISKFIDKLANFNLDVISNENSIENELYDNILSNKKYLFELMPIYSNPESENLIIEDVNELKKDSVIWPYIDMYNQFNRKLMDIDTKLKLKQSKEKQLYNQFLIELEDVRPNTTLPVKQLMEILKLDRDKIIQLLKNLSSETKNYGKYIKLEDAFVTSKNIVDLHDDIDDLIEKFDSNLNEKI